MPFFRYTSVSPEGIKTKGHLEAPNIEEAKRRLQSQDIYLVSLDPSHKISKSIKLNKTALIEIIEQLAELLNVGMPLYESLREIAAQHHSSHYYLTLVGLCERIQCGDSLAQAMRHYPESFSALIIAMVDAGQSSGHLNQTLCQLGALLRQQQRLQKQLLTAALYPIILLSFSFLIVIMLLTFVIPSLEEVFEGRTVHGLTHFVIQLSHILTQGWPYLIGFLLILTYACRQFLRSHRGKSWIEKRILKLPWIGSLIIRRELARFTHLMGVMLQGGVPLLHALQISREVIAFQALRQAFVCAEQKIVEGRLLSQELKHHTWIPPLTIRLLALGEEGGNLPQMFEKLASIYEAEVEKILSRIVTLAQPVLLLFMGAVVGLIMMAVLLPLTDIRSFM
ncbi:MAG: type II secretion system F family protein [Verrucomicrobia bacterium]|nr:type II secretion system F family protein [Verrucomicrobiota bacterium]MBS0646284.1 type II secretion system F family protein [Verrucomicrobiota bacterium]